MLRKLSWMAVAGAVAACGGEAGSQGINSLVRLDVVEAGDQCASGGSAIHTGLDTNANGVLDADEVLDTSWVCSGESGSNGAQALVLFKPEEPGANCGNGGTQIQTGLDTDGNGELKADEVTSSFFLCDDVSTVINGDVVVDTALVLSLLKNATEITGDLSVEQVNGAFALPRLETLGGGLYVEANQTLTSVSLPALQTAKSVYISVSHDALTELNLESLQTIEQSFTLESIGVGVLEALSLPALESVGDEFVITTDALVDVDLSKLATVGGAFKLSGNVKLETVQLDELQTAAEIIIEENEALASLNLPALTTATDRFLVEDNEALTSLSINALTTTAIFEVIWNEGLTTLEATALAEVSTTFTIRKNENLDQCEAEAIFEQLTTQPDPAHVRIENNQGTCG